MAEKEAFAITPESSEGEEEDLTEKEMWKLARFLEKRGKFKIISVEEYTHLSSPTADPVSMGKSTDPKDFPPPSGPPPGIVHKYHLPTPTTTYTIPTSTITMPLSSTTLKPGGTGAIPKTTYAASSGVNPFQIPRISIFSGEEPTPKSEVNFEVWKYEVRCLVRDNIYSQKVITQAIRKSLRGIATPVLLSLGESATIDEILAKMDGVFGNVSTGEALMQQFYSEQQREGETVASWSCRLEELLQKAIDKGHIKKEARNDMLRSKFWTSLKSERLKNATRHKYDSIPDFDELRRIVRAIEQEFSNSDQVSKLRGKTVHHSPVSADNVTSSQLSEITKQLSAVMTRVSAIEKKVDRVTTQVVQGETSGPQVNSMQPRNGGTRRRNWYHGGSRGRGQGRGSNQDQGHNRGNTNSQSQQPTPSKDTLNSKESPSGSR